MKPWTTIDIRGAIASGELPARDVARAIAALSVDDEAQIAEAIAAGWQYWSFATSRHYWCNWRRGDAGTMACGEGPISVDVAWEQLQEQGVLPASWQSERRVFVAETACLQCARAWIDYMPACPECRCTLRAVTTVSPRPLTVDDCAVMAADPDTIVHVEELARGMAGMRDAVVAWRTLSPAVLAQSLVEKEIEMQWILLEHGYSIDPVVLWEGGIVLAAPGLYE